jgi:hypothetical protein
MTPYPAFYKLRWGLKNFLLEVAWNLNPPNLLLPRVKITDTSHQPSSVMFFKCLHGIYNANVELIFFPTILYVPEYADI